MKISSFRPFTGAATFVVACVLGSGMLHAATFVVNNAGDSGVDVTPGNGICATAGGVCTFRAAIQEANAFAGADNIHFNIAPGGVQTIVLGVALPSITTVVTIDGTTQPLFAGTPIIEINAALGGANTITLTGAAASGSTIRGLVINRSPGQAIRILGSSNVVIAGNFLGTDVFGTAALSNQVGVYVGGSAVATNNNRIGGIALTDRNVISGNSQDGIQINGGSGGAANTVIQGNLVGVDMNGVLDLGNGSQGVAVFGFNSNTVIGGSAIGAANLISGNGNAGILIANAGTTGTLVQGNTIGTDAAGTGAIGNLYGVLISNSSGANTVGGAAAGASNHIAFNGNGGVTLDAGAGTANLISANEIHSNGNLGIDLGNDGVTPNDVGDADVGPNNLQNHPVLSAAQTNGFGSANFAGSLNGAPSTTYRVELFASTAADPSGFGEGERYLGFVNLTTDAAGNAVFGVTLAASVTAGELVTATATDPANNTSEFSRQVTAVGSLVVTTTANTVDGTTTSVSNLIAAPGADGRISLHEAILAANATGGADTIRFGIPLSDAGRRYYQNDAIPGSLTLVASTALPEADVTDFDPDYPAGLTRSWYRIQPTSALPTITGPVILDAATQPGSLAGGPVVELNGLLAGGAGECLTLSGLGSSFSTIRGLVIDAFGGTAIRMLLSSSNVVAGNYLGTDPTGTLAQGNQTGLFLQAGSDNRIGGNTFADRNVISGNLVDGIQVTGAGASGNLVQGNYIGLDVTATAALGNVNRGVAILDGAANTTVGGTTVGAGNVISGNRGHGIEIASAGTTGTRLQANRIGTDAGGATAIGNAGAGVSISAVATNTTIGGSVANAGNVIAFNGLDGVAMIGGGVTGHSIVGNSIFSNGGLGIDLNDDGPSPNDVGDVDTGPNELLNFPTFTNVSESGGTLSAFFELDVPAGWYRIDFFKNPSGADPTGSGEGELFVGAASVQHPGGGSVGFIHGFAGTIGDIITASTTVCTDGAACAVFGGSSELSAAVTATLTPPTLSSAGNQLFTVGESARVMDPIDLQDFSGAIKEANDIRIRIPLGYPMRWDPSDTTAVLGGSAAGKVSTAVKAFEDGGGTLVLDVIADFVAGDRLIISDLKFFSFTAPAGPANLELEIGNDGLAVAFDDKTITIQPALVPTLSSDADQVFVTGQPAVLMVPLTVSEGNTPNVNLDDDIRVRIPATFNMKWNPAETTAWITGPAASKVSTTVSFEDSDRTLVIDVQTSFGFMDYITVSGLYFWDFSGGSAPANLELEVDAMGTVIDFDDKTIRIDATMDVPVFTATATSMQVKLEWVYPAGACSFVRIVRGTAGFPAFSEPDPIVDEPCGTAGTKDSLVDSPLGNGTTYFYAAYVDHGAGQTGGKFVKARPFDTPATIHWAYSTGAASMAPPGLRFQPPDSFVYAVSNDSILHSMVGGASGGDWPGPWKPYKLGGPAQSRPPVVSFSVGGGNGAAFLGSQDGRVYAVDSVNGALKWDEPVASMVQAAPAGHFFFYNPAAFDLILVGSRNGSGANSFSSLGVHTGNPAWSFVNSGGQGGDDTPMGIISSGAVVDYGGNRAYFASRTHPSGSANTLWCVSFTATSVSLEWARALGNIDGSPVLRNGRLYVGTNAGIVYAVKTDGTIEWALALGDGPIKGFPFPRGSNQFFVSTNNKIWSVLDNVTFGSVSPGWPVTAIPSPSIPLHVPGTTALLVGSGDGKLYQMNVVTPLPLKSVVLGDGSAAVGAPTMDLLKMLLYVGTDAGVIYAVTFPLP